MSENENSLQIFLNKLNIDKEESEKKESELNFIINEINGFNCQEPNGAFYCFPNIEKTNKSSTVIQNLLLDKIGVATVAGTSFGEYGEGFIRLSCANSDAAIEEAIDRIKSIF